VFVNLGLKFVHLLAKTEQFANFLFAILDELTFVGESSPKCSYIRIKGNQIFFFGGSFLLVESNGNQKIASVW
jgi:hypothetical protein